MKDNFDHIPVISQPKDLKVNLYRHQLASIYEMEKRENQLFVTAGPTHIETNIGVNADITGYGKTLSMVTLMMRDKMEWNLNTPYSFTHTVSLVGGRIKKTTTETYEKLDTTLILVSQSIINQWYEEILKTQLSVKMVASKKSIENVIIDNYDVILVTPTMYNGLVFKYSQYAWKRFIFDEQSLPMLRRCS